MSETIARVKPSPRAEGARALGGGDGAIVHSPARVHATTWERFTVRSLALVKYASRDAETRARGRDGEMDSRVRASRRRGRGSSVDVGSSRRAGGVKTRVESVWTCVGIVCVVWRRCARFRVVARDARGE